MSDFKEEVIRTSALGLVAAGKSGPEAYDAARWAYDAAASILGDTVRGEFWDELKAHLGIDPELSCCPGVRGSDAPYVPRALPDPVGGVALARPRRQIPGARLMPTQPPHPVGEAPALTVYNGTINKPPRIVQLKKRATAVKFCGCGRLIGLATTRKNTCGRKACG